MMYAMELKKIDTYYGKSHILKGVSFHLKEGEILTLIGRNGAGKTTTLRTIMGLTPPSSGEIKFYDKVITGKEPFELARMGIGFVFEDTRIFPDLTVRDNLEIAILDRPGKEMKWNIERVFETFPILRNLEKRNGMNLSGGERQILAVTRALMGNPSLLLLDEPTEGLAPIIVKDLGKSLEEISKDMTILLSEQNVKFALDFAHRGNVIDKGMIRYEGTCEELRNNKEIQERFLSV